MCLPKCFNLECVNGQEYDSQLDECIDCPQGNNICPYFYIICKHQESCVQYRTPQFKRQNNGQKHLI